MLNRGIVDSIGCSIAMVLRWWSEDQDEVENKDVQG